ncbi:MAG: M42 family metallopeptidase [Planctomycetota bacterium]
MTYDTLRQLIEIDSPTGFTSQACDFVRQQLEGYGLKPTLTNKGAVRCTLGDSPKVALAAHVDTLGAIVCGIDANGTLKISRLGGLSLNMAEGEYVRVHTLEGKQYTGTLLLNNPSAHANKDLSSSKREPEKMHIRLDEHAKTKGHVRELGIRIGDFVAFDPRYQELPSGYIKSRYLDNKAGCYVLLEVARRLHEQGIQPAAEIFFSNYEEVGHGGCAGYSSGVEELLVIDMGVLGDACEGEETRCSICAKDSTGPYDYDMRRRLVELAEAQQIRHSIDVYPFYGSDGSAALRAGHDFRVALIGPGVAASHGVERTHGDGIEATIDLCLAYLKDRSA